MKKMAIIILVLSFILLAGLFIYEQGKVKQFEAEIQQAKQRQAELEKQNQIYDAQIKTLSILKQSLEQKLAGLEKEKAEINQKLKESEKRLSEIQARVAAMTPDDLVSKTRQILQDDGIEKTTLGAQFSLAAFQKNTAVLMEWQEFSLVKIPTLEAKVNNLEKANLNLENQVFLWKESERLWAKKSSNYENEIKVLNGELSAAIKQVSKEKRKTILTSILSALAGFGLGALTK